MQKKLAIWVCLVALLALTQRANSQDDETVMVRAEASTKLAPELVATKAANGQLLGITQDAQAVVRLPATGIAALAQSAEVKSYNKEVPDEVDEIKRLIISYKAGDKPTNESLNAAGFRVIEDYEKGTFLVVEAPDGIMATSVTALENIDEVTFAGGDYQVRIVPPARNEAMRARPQGALATPNDPMFPQLWGMQNIHAPQAWDKIHDSESIVVAVIDTGVDYNHGDLDANIWINADETPGNGLDDDGNGFVDDVNGWDFFDDDRDPMDGHNHGTHCAGTIGGVGNNNLGVVGVTWNVQIMALRFLGPGGGSTVDAIKCIDYAVDNGANIMSNSWGGGGFSNEMHEAIERAKNGGVLFVAAGGNSNSNNDINPHYPSSYENENVIAVGSITKSDTRSGFSCFGKQSVDIGAPGSDILSTVIGDSYDTFSGTSMATPHVSGALALIWAANPSNNWLEIRELLLYNARKVAALEDQWGHNAMVRGGVLDIAFLNKTPPPPSTGMPIAASAQFGYGQTVNGDASIAEVNIQLDEPMEVHITANTSASSGDKSLFTTGFHNGPSANELWYESLRFVSIPQSNQWVNFGASYAARLPAGSHTIYWKILLDGSSLELDSGSISVQAFALSSGSTDAAAVVTVRPASRSPNMGSIRTDTNGAAVIRILRGSARDQAAIRSSGYTRVPAGRR